MSEQHLFQHYAPEEQEFVEKMLDLCRRVEQSYSYQLTSFLNPRQEEIVMSLVPRFGLTIYSSSLILPTEYRRVIIAPEYYLLDENDFELQLLEIEYPKKFHRLSHSQILGTVLNQLGIRRDFIGDIFQEDNQWFLMADKRFASLIESAITKISKVPVKWKPVDSSQVHSGRSPQEQSSIFLVSSLRLDKVVAVATSLSRTQAVKLIESGQVKVNYTESKQVGKPLEIGQMVSIRGFGRIRLKELLGYSKQGKLKIEIEIIRK